VEAVSPQVLKTYEQESEQTTPSLEVAQWELCEIEAEAERLTQAGPEIDLNIEKLTMGVNNGKKLYVSYPKIRMAIVAYLKVWMTIV
jgi:structural maintenance of chromosome 4